jgi:predicted dehydrogenase
MLNKKRKPEKKLYTSSGADQEDEGGRKNERNSYWPGRSRVATGRKNRLAYEIQGTQGTVCYDLERMGEVQVYFHNDNEADRGFRTVLLNPHHKGYSAFQPAGGISIAYNDMKILEVHELFAAITQGAEYACNFEFGSKIDRTVDAVLESEKTNAWINIE